MPQFEVDAPVFFVRVTPRGKRSEPVTRIDVSDRIISFTFVDTESKADVLKLSINNHDLTQFDNGLWKVGQVLEFSWGYLGRMTLTRKGVIKKVKGNSSVMTVEAHAESVLMDAETKTRLFEFKTRSEVVTIIAEENGYEGDRLIVEDTEVEHEAINQARLTDAQFIRHLANKEGFEFYVDHTGFNFHKRDLGQTPIKTLTYYNEQGQGEVADFSIENDIVKRSSKVVKKGLDLENKKGIEGEGSDETTKDEDTLGEFIESINRRAGEITTTSAVNTSNDETQPTSETSAAAAEKAAKARYRKSKSAAIKLTIPLVGDPDMLAKLVFEFNIPSKRLAGKYYITEATHTIAGGYKTVIKCRRDSMNSNPGLLGTDEGSKNSGKKNKKKPDDDKNKPKEIINTRDGTITYR